MKDFFYKKVQNSSIGGGWHSVYKNMTKGCIKVQQSAENQAGQGKNFFCNVDIL